MVKSVKLNSDGIRELLQSDDVMIGVEKEALSQGQIVKKFVGFDRVQVIVDKGGTNADRAGNN